VFDCKDLVQNQGLVQPLYLFVSFHNKLAFFFILWRDLIESIEQSFGIAATLKGGCYLALLVRDSQISQTLTFLMPDRRKVTDMPNEQMRDTSGVTNFGDTGKVEITMEHTMAGTQIAQETVPSIYHNIPTGDIKDFLSRPRLIASGNLQSTDVATTFTPIDVISSIYTEFDKKIYGHFAARFDLKIRIETSADKFHAGRYILSYIPTFVPLTTTFPSTTWSISHAATLVQATQLQHVEIDLACDKMGELTIPFRYINEWYPLDSTDVTNKYGYLHLRPYSPLALGTSGSSSASYKIWLSLENVKFMGVGFFQSGISKQELGERGPISGPLKSVAGAAGALSNVPIVGYYAKPASWVLEALSKSFAHFGFSAPSIQSGVSVINNSPSFYGANSDVPRPTQSLSVLQRNEVSQDPFSAEKDEMSIDYLKQIFAYRTSFSWTTSTPVDTALASYYVSPLYPDNRNTSPDGTFTFHNYGPLGYIATRFKHWKGSIRYKFKLVKNNFHTGKLLVTWVPYDNTRTSVVVPSGIDDTYYTYRKIVDISEVNEFEVTVPFMSTKNFKCVFPNVNYNKQGAIYGTNFGVTGQDWSNGYLQVFVLDVLKAPDACPTTVTVLVEQAGGVDFQYMTPMQDRFVSDVTTYPTGVPYYSGIFQMGDPCAATEETMAGLPPFTDKQLVQSCYTSGGEKVDNLRTLLKRYTSIYFATDTNNWLCAGVRTGKSWYQTAAAVVSGLKNNVSNDDFRHYGPMFAFCRGSVRYKFWLKADAAGSSSIARNQYVAELFPNSLQLCSTATASGVAAYAGNSGAITSLDDNAAPRAIAVSSLSECLEFSIPFYTTDVHYSNEHVFLDDTATSTTASSIYPTGAPQVQAVVSVVTSSALSLDKIVERSIGEDFSFSYFISCPPLILPQMDGI